LITDTLLDIVWALLDSIYAVAETAFAGLSVTPLEDLSTSFAQLALIFGILANFTHPSVIAAALTFVGTWELAFFVAKLVLKVYRLFPFKFT